MYCIKDKKDRYVIYHNKYISELLEKNKDIQEVSLILNANIDEVKQLIENKFKRDQINQKNNNELKSNLEQNSLVSNKMMINNFRKKNKSEISGIFRIRFFDEFYDEIYYFNVEGIEDNISYNKPIFKYLLHTEEGNKNTEFEFEMLEKKVLYIEDNTRINNIVPYIKEITDKLKIYHLTKYIPKSYNKNDIDSTLILDLKRNNIKSVEYFFQKYSTFITNNKLDDNNYIIAVVPSHSKSDNNINGISMIAHRLIKKFGYTNGINLVIRAESIEKKAWSDNRVTFEQDVKSLTIKTNDISLKDKTIILLDDVVTTGDSLKAAAYILYSAGVKEIISIAIGKTVIPNE